MKSLLTNFAKNCGRFTFALFLFIFAFLCLTNENYMQKNASKTSADQLSNSNFTNLIVFAKFAGESEFIFSNPAGSTTSSVKDITENSYSGNGYSVKDYFYRASNGKAVIQSLYLFLPGGNSLTLQNTRGYYSAYNSENNPTGYTSAQKAQRMYDLKVDWATAINDAINNGAKISDVSGTTNYNFSELDKNGDGEIDSLTIIYKYSNEYTINQGDCLWSYRDYFNYVTINAGAKPITSGNYLQITANYNDIYTDENCVEFANLKTIIHEMGHIFGLKDLYRSGGASGGVYYMSAMARAITPVPQFLTAKEREALGWLNANNVQPISTSGTYAIKVTKSQSQEDVICYKLLIPRKKEETSDVPDKYLYLEYRKFDGTENKYDSQEKIITNKDGTNLTQITQLKSGLICSLVVANVKFPSNLSVTGNNWSFEVLSNGNATKVDAGLQTGESLTNIAGAIGVEVLDMTDDTTTFKIEGIENIHSHNAEHMAQKNPTCTQKGNIEYWYCEGCDRYFEDPELTQEIEEKADVEIAVASHSKKYVAPKSSTCIQEGNIEYWYCERCGKYYSDEALTQEITHQDTILPKTQHTHTIMFGYDATCLGTGLTDGIKCSECNQIIVSQEVIPKLPHTESGWIEDTPATKEHKGHRHTECTMCKTIIKEEYFDYVEGSGAGSENAGGGAGSENASPDASAEMGNANGFTTTEIVTVVCCGVAFIAGSIAFLLVKRRRNKMQNKE